MKILITGSSGMLGRALYRELSDKYEIVGLDICRNQEFNFIEVDITQRDETIEKIISQRPDMVVHTAAYTDVDGCEQNPEKAHKVNALGTETIALACQKCSAFLCYISTDFVFNGEKEDFYNEEDPPDPLNIYGQTKLSGEDYIKNLLEHFFIIRSSWLFGKGGTNFVDTIIEKASCQKTIAVVKDQFGSPTYTVHLAEALEKLLSLVKGNLRENRPFGIYHVTNSGSCSWFEFARKIIELKGFKNKIEAISSEEINRAARRPRNSRLDNTRYINLTGFSLPDWETALKLYLG